MSSLIYQSPFGPVSLKEENGALICCGFGRDGAETADRAPVLYETARQLDEYFAGRRKEFDLPLAPNGTVFQQNVWQALQKIPYGTTVSYKDIAVAIGNPQACRAVGMANHNNPIGIIVPCHRVIGANGKLTGYAGGLDKKQLLLDLEFRHSFSV